MRHLRWDGEVDASRIAAWVGKIVGQNVRVFVGDSYVVSYGKTSVEKYGKMYGETYGTSSPVQSYKQADTAANAAIR